MDVYGSLSSVQPVNKCASSAILPKDYLSSSSTAFLGQPEAAPKKKFPTALVVGGLLVGGVLLYYASKVGSTLAANPRCRLEVKQHPDGSWGVAQNGRMFPRKFERKSDAVAWRGGMGNECVPGYANNDSYSPFPVERIPGGRAAGMLPSDFDPVELARGAEHELEHTDDWRVAREIAQDHLIEDENYYEKLDAMERGAFRDNPKLQWQGSGSGAWARGPDYKYYRLLQRAPGEWLVYFDDVVIGAERTPALAKRLAQEHAGRRDNPWSEAGCVADCNGTFGKNNKPLYLKKCLAACHGTLLGKGLADLPKG